MALTLGSLSPRWPRFSVWLASIFRHQSPEWDARADTQQDHAETDSAMFEALFRRYEPQLTGYLWRMTGDMEMARDLCQETFVRAWQHYATVREYERLAQWLYRVATNLALNQRRRPPTASLADHEPISAEPVTNVAERELVRSILQALPPKQRALLVLREVQEFTYAELGTMLDMSPDAVKMALSRAREQFRQRYLREDRDEHVTRDS